MASVIRYDLINYFLREPVDITCSCPAFPEVKRVILCPRHVDVDDPWLLQEVDEVSAFVEVDDEGAMEYTVQEKSENFMDWVCWLLSLQELHDVYYWGAHHYINQNSVWKLRSSLWKPTMVKEWKPPGKGIFEGTVLYWRLQEFLNKGLRFFSKTDFPTKEFISALHLFLDSLPVDQLPEMRFVKKWAALESLVNDEAERNGYLYTFGQPGSDEFSSLEIQLKRVIDEHPSVLAKPNTNEPLTKQLSALERMPVKMIAKRFLDELSISYNEQDLNKIVKTRNDILHYIKTNAGLEELHNLDSSLRGMLSEIFCRKLDWDLEKGLEARYSTPYTEPLPGYLRLAAENHEVEATGIGQLESADGKHSFECKGRLTCNRNRLDGRFVSRDPQRLEMLNVMRDPGWVKLTLTLEDTSTILAEKAKLDHLHWGAKATVRGGPVRNFDVEFGLVALRLFRQIPVAG